ncbi:FG-GAP repeat domain-containing protein [Tundrisphaera lichenicola]|uniref:FG-GAP repeat domain-containing protein n=1 Tax=Tundrisphaera lichenicola TaxID=2029860 RepID=UPI003EBC1AB2
MNAVFPIAKRERRPVSGLRKSSRAFRPNSSALESRALLSSFDYTISGVPSRAALINLLTPSSPPPSLNLTGGWHSGNARPPGSNPHGPDGPGSDGAGPKLAPPIGTLLPIGPEPDNPAKNRVGLAAAEVEINGTMTPEFALADAIRGVVLVKVGFEGEPSTVLTTADGINGPALVLLQDVNEDTIPDLVVANSGGDNVLVFPGLVGGGVGPELSGGKGFAVGRDPVALTVGDVNGDRVLDLVVANKGSNNVTILFGHGAGPSWTADPGEVLVAGDAPVRIALQDVNGDRKPELFVLNSASNNVSVYRRLEDGTFGSYGGGPIAVGLNPSEMFVGHFDRRSGYDLVTVNTGSNNLSYVSDVGMLAPQAISIDLGGIQPITGFSSDLNRDGVLDLVVASNDGRMAILQGGRSGLELSGVISRPGFASPTALAAGNEMGSFYAAGTEGDLAQILSFNLGLSSDLQPTPIEWPSGGDQIDLIARLLPFGNSGVDLIAVLWDDARSQRRKSSEVSDHEAALPVPCTKIEETDEEGRVEDEEPPLEEEPPTTDDPDAWARYVLGLDEALDEPRDLLIALAEALEETGDGQPSNLRARPEIDPDQEATTRAFDEALDTLRSEFADPSEAGPDPGESEGEGAEVPARRLDLDSMPLVASSVLLAGRLILQASPPHPTTMRRRSGRRLVPVTPGEDRPTFL